MTVNDTIGLVDRLWRRIEVAEQDSRFGDAEDMREAVAALNAIRASTALPTCCVTGRIAGDSDACGDCDPCGAAHAVPDAVKRLLAEKDEWRTKYAEAMERNSPGSTDAAEVMRLREKVEILEAELRVTKRLAESSPDRDFGTHVTDFEYQSGKTMQLACKYAVPGLTLHDLVMIFDKAKKQAEPGDEFAGNPSKWPDVRGVIAVKDAIVAALTKQSSG